jgi:hypothetical protein
MERVACCVCKMWTVYEEENSELLAVQIDYLRKRAEFSRMDIIKSSEIRRRMGAEEM